MTNTIFLHQNFNFFDRNISLIYFLTIEESCYYLDNKFLIITKVL